MEKILCDSPEDAVKRAEILNPLMKGVDGQYVVVGPWVVLLRAGEWVNKVEIWDGKSGQKRIEAEEPNVEMQKNMDYDRQKLLQKKGQAIKFK